MQNLWSPWRSQYIESFKDNLSKECFLCNSAIESQNDDMNFVVFRRKYSYVVLNKFPYNAGHILISPINHVSDITDLNIDEFGEINQLLLDSVKIVKSIYKPHGYNLGLNIGSASGAGVPGHLHYHIVPRWQGDTNFMTSVGEVKVISQELDKTYQSFKSEFRRLFGE
jgi:ATP adenylyltransferase